RQHARYVEAVLGVELQDLGAVEHQVEVAGARPLAVERRSVLPPRAGDGAAPEDRRGLGRQAFPQHLAEALEKALLAAETQIDGAPAHLLFAETGADDVVRLFLGHVFPPNAHTSNLNRRSRRWTGRTRKPATPASGWRASGRTSGLHPLGARRPERSTQGYCPLSVTPLYAVKPRIITYQSPAAGLVNVQVSLLVLVKGRQLKVLVVGGALKRT